MRTHVRALAEPPPFLSDQIVTILKTSLASALTWWLGNLLGQPRPYFAVLAVIVVMQGHTYGSLLKAGQFLLGVAGGLVLGVLALRSPVLSPPVIGALILISLLLGMRIKVGPDLNNQIAISALLMLAIGAVNWGVIRLWETALGGVVAVVVSAALWPPNPVRVLRREVEQTRKRLKEDLRATIELLDGRAGAAAASANLERVRTNSERAHELVSEVARADEALRWNPWHAGRRAELDELGERLTVLAQSYRHVRSLARQAADMLNRADPAARRPAWVSEAREALWEVVRATSEALDRRLAGGDPEEPLRAARDARRRFLRQGEGDALAAAMAVEFRELAADLELPKERREEDDQEPTILGRLLAAVRQDHR